MIWLELNDKFVWLDSYRQHVCLIYNLTDSLLMLNKNIHIYLVIYLILIWVYKVSREFSLAIPKLSVLFFCYIFMRNYLPAMAQLVAQSTLSPAFYLPQSQSVFPSHSHRWSLSIWLIKWSADCAADCAGCGCCWCWSKYSKEFLGLALLMLQTIKPNHIWCSWRERQAVGQW